MCQVSCGQCEFGYRCSEAGIDFVEGLFESGWGDPVAWQGCSETWAEETIVGSCEEERSTEAGISDVVALGVWQAFDHGGKSTPSASDDDATAALTDNTTQHLIQDVLELRRELNIPGKMHVFGGSWGSTLALAYAIAHPETVQTIILRSVFLCRRADVDYFLQGNAADFTANPLAMPVPGTYLEFPTAPS
jgi:pimeloyl-ACP methyl ester carboxylesterase